MAIGFTAKVQVQSSVDGTTYTTDTGGDGDGTFTPTASTLLLAAVLLFGDATDPSSVSGNGATWAKVGSTTWVSAADNITIWAALAGGSPTDTAVSVATGASRTGGMIFCNEVSGAYVSGTASQAIAQAVGNSATSGTTASCTLAAAANSANRGYAIVGQTTSTGTIVAGTNWTNLFGINKSILTPTREARDQWRSDAFDTGPNATLGASTNWGILAVEIRDASAPPSGGSSTDSVGFIPL